MRDRWTGGQTDRIRIAIAHAKSCWQNENHTALCELPFFRALFQISSIKRVSLEGMG